MDYVFNRSEISGARRDLLRNINDFCLAYMQDLENRHYKKFEFYRFVAFCNCSVFELVNWEQINPNDLKDFPAIPKLMFAACFAARHEASINFSHKGMGRRSFGTIATGALAVNILPRLQSILQRWGITIDPVNDSMQIRRLAPEEEELLQCNFFFD